MTETLARPQALEATGRENGAAPTEQSGSVLFAELVWAHHRWHLERTRRDGPRSEVEQEYRRALEEFQRREGTITGVYWSTRDASAVAMTVGKPRGRWNPLGDTDTEVRLHRVSDWVTKDASGVAELLHKCDLLAIRVGEVLRGTSERIAMRWILAVQAHLLGFIERGGRAATPEEKTLLEAQTGELRQIEDYYHRAAGKTGRLVYVGGMLIGAAIVAVLGGLIALPLLLLGLHEGPYARQLGILFLCYGAGAVGALVSVMSRMGAARGSKFQVDFEVGRPVLRRLGSYRPFVGAVFGVALYFLLASGLLRTEAPTADQAVYFYGIAGFFAGFSERWTNVIFGGAQRLIGGGKDDASGEQPGEEPARPRDGE
jgi:hypothetical protein